MAGTITFLSQGQTCLGYYVVDLQERRNSLPVSCIQTARQMANLNTTLARLFDCWRMLFPIMLDAFTIFVLDKS